MKTIIVSTHCSRTDFIEYQYKTFKKFIKCEYEYIVCNDAKEKGDLINFNNSNIKNEIKEKCDNLGIKCIDVPQNLHKDRRILFPNTIEPNSDHPSARTSVAIQYIYNWVNNYGFDYLIIIDADMFLIDYIDINDFSNFDIAYIPQSRCVNNTIVNYMWNGLIIINNKNLFNFDKLNFDTGKVNGIGVDTGGQTHFWLEKYKKQVTIKILDCWHISDYNKYKEVKDKLTIIIQKYFEKLLGDNYGIINKELLLERKVLHFSNAGGNWNYTCLPFKNFLIEKYNDSNIMDKLFNKNRDIITNEWREYNYKQASLFYLFINEVLDN
jgi:hypothetical protein